MRIKIELGPDGPSSKVTDEDGNVLPVVSMQITAGVGRVTTATAEVMLESLKTVEALYGEVQVVDIHGKQYRLVPLEEPEDNKERWAYDGEVLLDRLEDDLHNGLTRDGKALGGVWQHVMVRQEQMEDMRIRRRVKMAVHGGHTDARDAHVHVCDMCMWLWKHERDIGVTMTDQGVELVVSDAHVPPRFDYKMYIEPTLEDALHLAVEALKVQDRKEKA